MNVATVNAPQASDEDDEKATDTDADDAPRHLCCLVFDDGFSDGDAVEVVFGFDECHVLVDFFALWN